MSATTAGERASYMPRAARLPGSSPRVPWRSHEPSRPARSVRCAARSTAPDAVAPEAAPSPEAPEQAPKSFLRGLGLTEKAKGAMGAAAGGAAALKGKATSALSTLSEQASSRAQEMLGAGLDQVKGVAADLNAALPIVKLAGY